AQYVDRVRNHYAGRARAQGKPGRAFPRRLSRQERRLRQGQHRGSQGRGRRAAGNAGTHPRDARGAEGDHSGDELMASATFRIWRGEKDVGRFQDYSTEISEGMVVLDAVHNIQAESAGDLAVRWNCKAGK